MAHIGKLCQSFFDPEKILQSKKQPPLASNKNHSMLHNTDKELTTIIYD